jgi:hypothetical protein
MCLFESCYVLDVLCHRIPSTSPLQSSLALHLLLCPRASHQHLHPRLIQMPPILSELCILEAAGKRTNKASSENPIDSHSNLNASDDFVALTGSPMNGGTFSSYVALPESAQSSDIATSTGGPSLNAATPESEKFSTTVTIVLSISAAAASNSATSASTAATHLTSYPPSHFDYPENTIIRIRVGDMADEFTYYVTYLMTGQTRYFWKYRLNSVAFQKTKATARVGSAAAFDRWAVTWLEGDWDH